MKLFLVLVILVLFSVQFVSGASYKNVTYANFNNFSVSNGFANMSVFQDCGNWQNGTNNFDPHCDENDNPGYLSYGFVCVDNLDMDICTTATGADITSSKDDSALLLQDVDTNSNTGLYLNVSDANTTGKIAGINLTIKTFASGLDTGEWCNITINNVNIWSLSNASANTSAQGYQAGASYYPFINEYVLFKYDNLCTNINCRQNISVRLAALGNDNSDKCFFDNYNLTVLVDEAVPIWSGNVTNNTFPKNGEQVSFNVTLSDDVLVSAVTFSWNGTGTWTNDTVMVVSNSPYVLAVNKTISNTAGNHSIGWKVFFNDTVGNLNSTDLFFLAVANSNVTANVTLNATSSVGVQEILCSNVTFDPDGDLLSSNVGWFVNNTFFDFRNSVLGLGNTTINANVTCQMNISDGYNNYFFNSSMFTIGDVGIPVITKFAFFDLGSYTQTQNANISANCTDDNQVSSVKAYVYSFFDSGATIDLNLTLLSTGPNQYSRILQMSGVGTYGIRGTYCLDGSGNTAFNGNLTNVTVAAIGAQAPGGGGGGSDVCVNPQNCNNLSVCCFGYSCVSSVCVTTSTVLASQPTCGNGVCEHLPPTYSEDSLSCAQDCPLNPSGLVNAFSNFTTGGFSKFIILFAVGAIIVLAFLPKSERYNLLGKKGGLR